MHFKRRNIENYHFDSNPRFPHFKYMQGANLGSLLYGGVSVMSVMVHSVFETCVKFYGELISY